MKNILIPIEFERHAPELLDTGLNIARKFESKVWLIHIAAPDPDFVGYEAGPQSVRDARAETLKSERIFIQKLAEMMKGEGVDCIGMIIEGKTSDTILEEIEKLNIDLVIIGHHHKTWFKKVFSIGTDSDIIERAKIPVLTIPI